MKLTTFLATAFLATSALAAPPAYTKPNSQPPAPQPPAPKINFDLIGFAASNPIGRTTGGAGGKVWNVFNETQLVQAVKGNTPKIVILHGDKPLKLAKRLFPGANTSLYGAGKGAEITGSGITVANTTNVIIRNLKISKILDNDGITLTNSTRVWVDHCEFASEFSQEIGPDTYDGQLDIVRASDWVTVSWNYFHDHWKSSLVGNSDVLRDVDFGHLHITYHHNYWRNSGTRGPAGRFGHQHVYNNFYEDFHYQAIHSRSDNQVLVEANVFRGDTREALSTYGLVIPEDSPNTSPLGDEEIDGFANLGAKNDWGPASINITQVGNFTKAPYKYSLTPLKEVISVVKKNAGLGKVRF